MRDGVLPAVLLALAFGLMLGRATLSATMLAIMAATVTALVVSILTPPVAWADPLAIGAAVATVLASLAVYRDRPLGLGLSMSAALVVGVSIGGLVAQTGQPRGLLALIGLLLALPSAILIARRRAVVVKVLASWILAVSLLSAGLALTQGANASSDHLD